MPDNYRQGGECWLYRDSAAELNEMPEMGASNAVLSDPFGYVWMLHQLHRVVSFEERTKIWDEKLKSEAEGGES
ncbi:MAG: hypothetical protein AB2L09_04350 [Coriobacteriia bacterium]